MPLGTAMGKGNKHGAADSAVGYLFQCRFALFLGLSEMLTNPSLEVSIEKFDDVAFELEGDPVALIQTKHHLRSTGRLTDHSPDLWKTIRIWAELVDADPEAPSRLKFTLLTTGEAPPGSAASMLRARERKEDVAHDLLLNAAATSASLTNAPGCRAFCELPEIARKSLLKAVTVLDRSPNILDVREEICALVRLAVRRDKLDPFVERLEGWWFAEAIRAMSGDGRAAIPVTEIEAKIDELREAFRRDRLPIDFADRAPPASVVADSDGRAFVRQLRLINVGDRRVEYAVRDYYRAYEQRSRWAREELLVDGEIRAYERRLLEAWEPRFEALRDELAEACLPSARVAAGQALYKWAETEADFPLRTVRERFLTHGSYHILVNRRALGWHPDYAEHIEMGDAAGGEGDGS